VLIQILGPVEVRTPTGWQRLGAPKWRTLLARLTISIGSPVAVDTLVDELWGDKPPAGAVNQVHGYVSRLRTLIGDRDRTLLVTRSPGYELMINPDDLDSRRFDDLVDRGEQALRDHDHERAAEFFTHSLQLWRGPAYADVPASEQIRTEADRLAERRLHAQEGRIDADLGSGRPAAELITELQAAVAAHPLREHLWAQLMLALYRADRQSDALLAFQEVYHRLDSELGVQPGAALTELQQRILAGDSGLRPPTAPPAPSTTVRATTTPTTTPRSSGQVPRQLPADIADFTGREQELTVLDDWLAASDAEPAEAPPALALVGGGGLGKTTLALHWAHLAADRFPDGQLYVNLRGFATVGELPPEQALSGFLSGLGVPPGQVPVDRDEAAALFRTRLSDRRILVVLDNAGGDHQVLPLLPGSGPSRVLVTSRDPLPGTIARGLLRPFRLGELTTAETEQLLTRIVGRSRVSSDPDAAGRLARLCAGLPLAVRITAAQLAGNPELPVADQLAELEDGSGPRLAALDLDPAHPDDPSASVRAAFDLSFARLSESARRLFVLVSLTPGDSFSDHAAAALAGADPSTGPSADLAGVRAELDQLGSRGMLGRAGPRRHALHDLLRAYATEQQQTVDAAERRAAGVRLFAWYLASTGRAVRAGVPPLMSGLPDRDPVRPEAALIPEFDDAAADWLDTELPQLLALATAAAQDPDRPVWQLSDLLRPYFFHRGNPGDWLTMAAAGLRSARVAGLPMAEAAAELSLTQAYRRISRFPEATAHAERALALCETSGWQAGAGSVLNELAVLRMEQGDVRSAPEFLQRAAEVFRGLGQRAAEASLMINLGHATRQLGDLPAAARQLNRALDLLPPEATGTPGIIHAALSDIYRLQGRLDRAAEELDRAEAALSATTQGRASYFSNRCEQKLACRDFDGALADAQQALELTRKQRSVRLEAVALIQRAEVRICAGDPAEALADAIAAEDLARRADAGYEWVQSLGVLARAQVRTGAAAEARRTAARAAAEAESYGYRIEHAQAESVIAEAELDLGQPERARGSARQARELYRSCDCRYREEQLAELLARA